MPDNQPDPHFSWSDAAQDLHGVQDRVSLYITRFKNVGKPEIARRLEAAIWQLMDAQHAAEDLSGKG